MKSKSLLRIVLLLVAMTCATSLWAQNIITLTTTQAKGKELKLTIEAYDSFTVEGATLKEGNKYTLTAEDGKITLRGDITKLNCQDNQLSTIDVSKNTLLEELHCSNNQLTTLDVSKNTLLKQLNCQSNQLSALDLSKNIMLKMLSCANNQLSALDVSKNISLTTLSCANNQLTKLDLAKNTQLLELNCGNNQLSALDVAQNTMLTSLSCTGNQISTLNLSQHEHLQTLFCHINRLIELNLSGCKKLSWLNCSGNQLTELNLSQCTELVRISCFNNQLSALDVSKSPLLEHINCTKNNIESKAAMDAFIASLPDRSILPNGELRLVDFTQESDGKPLPEEGNMCDKKQITAIHQQGWMPYATQYDEAGLPLTEEYAGSEVIIRLTTALKKGEELQLNIPSNSSLRIKGATLKKGTENRYTLTAEDGRVTLLGHITELDCSGNQITAIDLAQCARLTQFNCLNNQLTTLDLSRNAGLKDLNCLNNQLTTLDLSQNTELRDLNCSANPLTTLNLSQNTKLMGLHCERNQLSELDLSKNTELVSLECSLNKLTTLNLSQNTKLTRLYCERNQLSELDLSQCTELTVLACTKNKISGKDAMDTLIASLPNRSGMTDKGAFIAVNFLNELHKEALPEEGNVCDKNQVAAARERGWSVLEIKLHENNESGNVEYKEYAGSEPVAIEEVLAEEDSATIVAIYTTEGHRIAELQPGVNIIRLSNGTTRKVLVRE